MPQRKQQELSRHALLLEVFPLHVSSRLLAGLPVVPETFNATVFFSDVVNFTEMSSSLGPVCVMTFLNELYSIMDAVAVEYGIYKVMYIVFLEK